MARGRKPIQRTLEEAKAARRNQVRKNVQAFRDRKRDPPSESQKNGAKSKQWKFVELDCGNRVSQLEGRIVTELDTAIELFEPGSIGTVHESQSPALGSWCSHRPVNLGSRSVKPGHTDSESPKLLPPSISGAIVSRQQFVSNSAHIFFPGNPTQPRQCADIGPHWVQTVPELINRCDVLDVSVQALCLLQIAHIERECWLLEASRSYYGEALHRLKSALFDSAKPFRKTIVTTAMVLSGYELFDDATDGQSLGWKCHLQGASSYLSKFSAHDNVFDDQLSFHFLETVCVFDALRSRKASPFARSRWWEDSLGKFGGDSYGPLLRLMALIPSLMEKSDNLQSLRSSEYIIETATTLIDSGLSLKGDFDGWQDKTAAMVPDFAYREGRKSELIFPNLYVGRLHLLYWSSIIALHGVISSATESLQLSTEAASMGTSSSPSALENAHLKAQANACAVSICRSVDFCLQPDHGIVGRSIVLQPLWLAADHFELYSPDDAQFCSQIPRSLGQDPWETPSKETPGPGKLCMLA